MSADSKLTVSCPACGCSYELFGTAGIETNHNENFHCGTCDYTFAAMPMAADTVPMAATAQYNDIPDSAALNLMSDFVKEQPATDINLRDIESEVALTAEPEETPQADHTQVVDSDLLEEIRNEDSYNKFSVSVDPEAQHEDYSQYAVSSFSDNTDYESWDTPVASPANTYNQTDPDPYRSSASTIHGGSFENRFSPAFESSFPAAAEDHRTNPFGSENYAAPGSERSANATMILMIVPILLALSALSYLTFTMENNLKTADAVLTRLFPSDLREPPAGLYILEPVIQPLVLDSGDIVNVIQGKIANKTKKTIEAIQLEGLGFSSAGQLNHREKTMLGNPVSIRSVKLKNLTPSNIREVQNKDVKRSIRLRPNSEMDFVYVFTEPASSSNTDMNSYAIRIYSVK